MRLGKRLFLQIFIIYLIIFQSFFLYTIYQTHEANKKDIIEYEMKLFSAKNNEYMKRIRNSSISDDDCKLKKTIYTNRFREIFPDNAAFFWEGKEAYNNTTYTFIYEQITRMISNEQEFVIDTIEGNKLLLLYLGHQGKVFENNDCGIIWCKDITSCYARTRILLIKGEILFCISVLLFALLLGISIRRALLPLQELKIVVRQICNGDYSERVKVYHNDEVGELTMCFNELSEKIETSISLLQEQNQIQRRLVAGIAHELKTPMTALIGYSDMLLTLKLSEKQRVKSLHYIGSECRRLSRLSSKMMELIELNEKKIIVDKENISIEELFQDISGLTIFRLQEKNITLVLDINPKGQIRELDRDLCISFLINLIDNAFKATSEDGIIRLFAMENAIGVEDFGKGIKEEDLEHVTEAFYMVDKSRARTQGSVGLGLALCKKIAELMGGRLVLQSTYGSGTKAYLEWENE